MSDMEPFSVESSPSELEHPASTAGIFKPDLEGFDWPSYKVRQAAIEGLMASDGDIAAYISDVHANDPANGTELNNAQNAYLKGTPLVRLKADKGVFTNSVVEMDLPGLSFDKGVASDAVFRRIDLRGADLTNAVAPRIDLSNSDLTGARLINAILTGANFTNTILDGADMSGTYLVGAQGFTIEQLQTAILNGARVIKEGSAKERDLESLLGNYFSVLGSAEDMNAQLEGVPVSVNQVPKPLQAGRRLRGLYVSGGVWDRTDFTRADMTGMVIEGGLQAHQATLRAVSMGGAIIRNSSMVETDMFGAWAAGTIFENVSLKGSDVTGANLAGALFRDADLSKMTGLVPGTANTSGIVIDVGTILPKGYGFDGINLQATAQMMRELGQ